MAHSILNTAILLTSLSASLLLAEGICRMVIPAGQSVQITSTHNQQSVVPTEKKVVTERGGIDTLLDWSGSHGLRLNPNIQATIVDHRLSKKTITIETNSIGIRDKELPTKQEDEFRVLVLGDSIVFGDYVVAEETLTSQLEMIFRSTAKRSKNIRFINAGIPGANAADQTNLYLEIREKIKPDLVLQMMYLNDSQDSREYYAHPLSLPWAYSRLLVWLSERVTIIQDFLRLENNTSESDQRIWREKFRAGRDLQPGDFTTSQNAYDFEIYNAFNDFGRAWNPNTWTKLQSILHTMKDLVEQNSSTFAVALLPIHMQIKSAIAEQYPQEQFQSVCSNLSLNCYDPLSLLRNDWQKSHQELLYDHCHYQPIGYTILAQGLSEYLVKNNLIPQ